MGRLAFAERHDVPQALLRAALALRLALAPGAARPPPGPLPPALLAAILGARRMDTTCLWEDANTLDEAEERALMEIFAHAALADGQDILDHGCGWGALALWLAERLPRARITAVCADRAQRMHIEQTAWRLGLAHLRVVVAAEAFTPAGQFDRVFAIGLGEPLAARPALPVELPRWLRPEGRALVQGVVPRGVPPALPDGLAVEAEWRWGGDHHAQTARAWLARLDGAQPALAAAYGTDAALWHRRWRLFFLGEAARFAHHGGRAREIRHFRLRPGFL